MHLVEGTMGRSLESLKMFIIENERAERKNMLSYVFEQDKNFGCFIKSCVKHNV